MVQTDTPAILPRSVTRDFHGHDRLPAKLLDIVQQSSGANAQVCNMSGGAVNVWLPAKLLDLVKQSSGASAACHCQECKIKAGLGLVLKAGTSMSSNTTKPPSTHSSTTTLVISCKLKKQSCPTVCSMTTRSAWQHFQLQPWHPFSIAWTAWQASGLHRPAMYALQSLHTRRLTLLTMIG